MKKHYLAIAAAIIAGITLTGCTPTHTDNQIDEPIVLEEDESQLHISSSGTITKITDFYGNTVFEGDTAKSDKIIDSEAVYWFDQNSLELGSSVELNGQTRAVWSVLYWNFVYPSAAAKYYNEHLVGTPVSTLKELRDLTVGAINAHLAQALTDGRLQNLDITPSGASIIETDSNAAARFLQGLPPSDSNTSATWVFNCESYGLTVNNLDAFKAAVITELGFTENDIRVSIDYSEILGIVPAVPCGIDNGPSTPPVTEGDGSNNW